MFYLFCKGDELNGFFSQITILEVDDSDWSEDFPHDLQIVDQERVCVSSAESFERMKALDALKRIQIKTIEQASHVLTFDEFDEICSPWHGEGWIDMVNGITVDLQARITQKARAAL